MSVDHERHVRRRETLVALRLPVTAVPRFDDCFDLLHPSDLLQYQRAAKADLSMAFFDKSDRALVGRPPRFELGRKADRDRPAKRVSHHATAKLDMNDGLGCHPASILLPNWPSINCRTVYFFLHYLCASPGAAVPAARRRALRELQDRYQSEAPPASAFFLVPG